MAIKLRENDCKIIRIKIYLLSSQKYSLLRYSTIQKYGMWFCISNYTAAFSLLFNGSALYGCSCSCSSIWESMPIARRLWIQTICPLNIWRHIAYRNRWFRSSFHSFTILHLVYHNVRRIFTWNCRKRQKKKEEKERKMQQYIACDSNSSNSLMVVGGFTIYRDK